MEEIAKWYLKGKEIIKNLDASDYEVIGGACVASIIVNAVLGTALGGVVAGVVIGLFILKKI